jgi:hypothetical protein
MSNAIKSGTLAFALALLGTGAHAEITPRLKQACRAEYFAYCSEHAVGSTSLRDCMRAVEDRLSQTCVKELAASGEASQSDIHRYKARKRR